jgi:hypothetical protein
MDNSQIPHVGMVVEEKGNPLGIKGLNQKKSWNNFPLVM